MKKPWSLSTTIRNPERILPFLKTLSEMEGDIFDVNGQIKFQTLLIKNRLYRPESLPEQLSKYYEIKGDSMTMAQASEIFDFMLTNSAELQKDPGLRGRTSVSPLTQKGLAIAKQSRGQVKITKLGKEFLDKQDFGEVLLSYFIKWQIPNPLENGYSSEDGYNIKPFIATLQLIKRTNERMVLLDKKAKGISKNEFCLFVPTLISELDIDNNVKAIVRLREELEEKSKKDKEIILKNFRHDYIKNWLGINDEGEILRHINNLREYGDSILRNFRLTRYLYIRGNGYYVDLEPRRLIEIEKLLSVINVKAEKFKSEDSYIDYISDISLPELPWEDLTSLTSIIESLASEIHEYENSFGTPPLKISEYNNVSEAKSVANNLRDYRRELQEKINHEEAQNLATINTNIEKMLGIYSLENKSLMLEKYSTLCLHSLDDALEIKPNYSVGDDNEPIFTAPAGKPDIECYYENFDAICEVTMLRTCDQWYKEGQPVMRHLRDFEKNNSEKETYCLFIAPQIHRDTLNTFWLSVKYEYEGEKQKIVPLNIENFAQILKVLLECRENGKNFNHLTIQKLYDEIIEEVNHSGNSEAWYARIPEILSNWKCEVLR